MHDRLSPDVFPAKSDTELVSFSIDGATCKEKSLAPAFPPKPGIGLFIPTLLI
jgi:hypothetical protein